jgi:hypothetical protein
VQRFFKSFGIFFCMICVVGLVFAPLHGSASELQQSEFAQIDGKATTSNVHDAKVVAVSLQVVLGKQVLYGFTDKATFHKYLTSQKATNTLATVGRNYATFYEHIDKRGAKFNVHKGYQINYVGNGWNDKISSVVPSCKGRWTVLYQHRDFDGEALAIQNSSNSCRYYHNLTNYYMQNGNSWNDQVSSIRVY